MGPKRINWRQKAIFVGAMNRLVVASRSRLSRASYTRQAVGSDPSFPRREAYRYIEHRLVDHLYLAFDIWDLRSIAAQIRACPSDRSGQSRLKLRAMTDAPLLAGSQRSHESLHETIREYDRADHSSGSQHDQIGVGDRLHLLGGRRHVPFPKGFGRPLPS